MLAESSEVKHVGITFDEHLTFNSHIKTMNAKLKRANNLLAISRHCSKESPKSNLLWSILLSSQLWE